MRRTFAALSLAATAAVLAACGGSSSSGTKASDFSPSGELKAGFEGLAKSSSVTATGSLKTDAATIKKVAATGSDPSTLTDQQAGYFVNGQLVLTAVAPSGKSLSSNSADTALDVSFTESGKALVDFRDVSQSLYVQGDVKDLVGLAGQKASVFDNLQAETDNLPPFVKAFVNGQWVSLPASTAQALEKQVGGGAEPSGSQPTPFVTALEGALTKDVTVTRTGHTDKGDELTVVGNVKTVGADLLQALQSAQPALSTVLSKENPSSLPDQQVTIKAYVDNGKLTELNLDLLQFAPASEKPANTTLPLVLDFSTSKASVSAPSGATPVDVSQLISLVGALGGGSSTP